MLHFLAHGYDNTRNNIKNRTKAAMLQLKQHRHHHKRLKLNDDDISASNNKNITSTTTTSNKNTRSNNENNINDNKIGQQQRSSSIDIGQLTAAMKANKTTSATECLQYNSQRCSSTVYNTNYQVQQQQ